ncbi:hypothetical protein ACP70R_006775 [Stipagrostis hirtigluma subsp. patula]
MDGDTPTLDPSLAPVLLFDCGRGGADDDEEEANRDSKLLIYSIPRRQLLAASTRGLDHLVDGANWITPQGWVLTLDPATRDASLHDPFTSRRVPLPPDRENLLSTSDETKCILSTHRPADPGCVVLVVHRNEPVLCYCRPGSRRWLRHEYRPELLAVDDRYGRREIINAMTKLTAAGGAFYTNWDGKLATLRFSPDHPTLSTSHVTDEAAPTRCYFLTEACLVESCGELFTVRFCYTQLCDRRILHVEVEKLDGARSAWVKVAGLGDRVFVVGSGQFGASMPADRFGLRANCVYFTNKGDKGLYVHSMEQGTTTLHNPGSDIPDSTGSILLIHAI